MLLLQLLLLLYPRCYLFERSMKLDTTLQRKRPSGTWEKFNINFWSTVACSVYVQPWFSWLAQPLRVSRCLLRNKQCACRTWMKQQLCLSNRPLSMVGFTYKNVQCSWLYWNPVGLFKVTLLQDVLNVTEVYWIPTDVSLKCGTYGFLGVKPKTSNIK